MYTPLNGDGGGTVGDTGYMPSVAQRRVHEQHQRQQHHQQQHRNDHDDSIADFTINSATVFKTPNLPGASQNRRRRRVRQRLPNVPWPFAFFLCAILTPVAGLIMMGIGIREKYDQYKKSKAGGGGGDGGYRSFPTTASPQSDATVYRRIFENDGDWLVVVCVGILYQVAVFVPIYIAADPFAYRQIVDDLHVTGDYYGAFALAPAMGFYLNVTVYLFGFLEARYEGIDEDSLLATQALDEENGSFASGGDGQTPSGVRFPGRNSYNESNPHLAQNGHGRPVRSSTAINTVVVGQQGITLSAKSLRTAVNIRRTIREATVVHSELTILVAFVIGTFEMLATRLCALSANPCDTLFTFQDARFSVRHYYAMTSIFWVCLFSVFNICVIYAVTVYYQQLLQLREFRYANGGRQAAGTGLGSDQQQGASRQGGRAGSPTTTSIPILGGGELLLRLTMQQRLDQALKPLEDLSSPESISIWTFTWQQFILDIKRKPLTVATTTSTFLALVATILGCTFYIAIFNLQARGSEVAEFTTPLAAVMAFAAFCMGVFVYVTVQVSNAVEIHTKTIAQLQNDTQVRVNDEGDSYAGRQKQLLLAKVRVLQSLDTYLRHSDSRPKLVGMSVESLRWTVIIIGLVILNACFFGLYYSWCYQA